jgi:DNA-directed RNA polymerase specialized sigma24 family protein
VEELGRFRPGAGALRDLALSHIAQQGDEPDPSPQRARKGRRKRTAPRIRGGRPLWRRFDVAAALSRLSPVHRELLVLAYFRGLSQREISERTNTPLGTVKSRTTAALRALRETMGFDEDRWSAGE